MKIGILTYHRAENYGALLQAYALMTYLKGIGYDVSFVDYWPNYHEEYFKLFPLQQLKHWKVTSKLKFLLKLLLWFVPRIIRKKRMQQFMYDRLDVKKKIRYRSEDRTDHYDVVVYGSDQIWRKQHLGGVDFDSWYFGADNVQADKKIVYAGSMGTVITSFHDDLYIKNMMKNFSSVSVREKDLNSYLGRLNINSSLVIDPVFLLSKNQWEKLFDINKSERYILFYNLLNTQDSIIFAENLGHELKLPIKELNKKMAFQNIGKRYIYAASVEQFLELIHGAEYVVSNSFHGVAMSIIFQKQFFAVGMGNRSNRVKSLLQSLNLSDRYTEYNEVDIVNVSPIDYRQVIIPLQILVDKSKSYLKDSI